MNIFELRSKLDQQKGKRDSSIQSLKLSESNLIALEKKKEFIQEAQLVHQIVSQKTQQELEYRISEIVTLALASVFDNPYEFQVEFVVRRDKTEADLWFVRDGKKADPMTATGGGELDVASFGLRVAMWTLQKPRTRPTFILDEPAKHLSRNYHSKFGKMVKAISEKLGLQFIMVAHSRDMALYADKVFDVVLERKRGMKYLSSKVTEIQLEKDEN